VLLVLDGLGWEQLRRMQRVAPTVAGAEGGPITSVAPTTTATALTSITTGAVPSDHGVVGYRIRVLAHDGAHVVDPDGRAGAEVLNVLRWRTREGDMRSMLPASEFQKIPPFGGAAFPAVTRHEFAATGFTALHLAGARLLGWAVPSTLLVHVRVQLEAGESFVYAYYDGLDKVAHAQGLGEFYEAEMRAVDALVGGLVECLPPGAVLVVTSDHGQVEVGDAARLPDPAVLDLVELLSGEGRFRWLHAREGASGDLLAAASEAHGAEAWVLSRQEILDQGWFGGMPTADVAARLGDVALVAREPVAFLDPADTGETRLAARHGSLTPAEMYVPLLAFAAP
jgi:predicted AlkP superfamily pyrophosphatase or phosphodiesterase